MVYPHSLFSLSLSLVSYILFIAYQIEKFNVSYFVLLISCPTIQHSVYANWPFSTSFTCRFPHDSNRWTLQFECKKRIRENERERDHIPCCNSIRIKGSNDDFCYQWWTLYCHSTSWNTLYLSFNVYVCRVHSMLRWLIEFSAFCLKCVGRWVIDETWQLKSACSQYNPGLW